MKSLSVMHEWIFFVIVSLSLLPGCAHVGKKEKGSLVEFPPRTISEIIRQDQSQPVPRSSLQENGDIVIHGVALKNTDFDIPVTINSRVEFWIDYFCGRGRGHFERYLERSEFFIPYIVPLLKQNGLPADLVYLAMIESGFNNLARSRAKAVGPWQFISATGKRYGLLVNWWVDERRDIRKSTLAAVEYLRDLYSMFQSWELAAAAYNAGEAKIARAIQRYGSKDFWVLAQHRFLRPETRDYVPKIMAAALISKNRSQFGFPEMEKKPAADEAVAPDGEIVKVIKTDKPLDDPASDRQAKADMVGKTSEEDDDEDGVDSSSGEGDGKSDESPPSTAEIVPATVSVPLSPTEVSESPPLAKSVPTPHLSKDGQVVGGEELAEFEVRSPADLLKIARAAGLSYQTVKSLNPELVRWCTPPMAGTYRVKLPTSVKEKFLVTYNHAAFPRQVQFMAYRVRRGDTLSRIASRFGIRVDPIADLNGLPVRMPLKNGAQVILPIPNDRSRSLASLEVTDPPEKRKKNLRKKNRHYRISYKNRESARSVRRPGFGDT